MSFMNFSGAVRPGYQTKRTSTVFVGDSITWGYGLDQNQTIGYNIQSRINTTTGFTTSATWGNSSNGLDICARNVTLDDTTTNPFQGGAPPVPYNNSLLTQSGAISAGLGVYPYSDTTNNSAGSNVSTSWASASPLPNCPDAITLTAGASISWNATYSTSTGYIIVGLMGAGTVSVKQGSTLIQTLTAGGSFNATVINGSTTMTLTSAVTGTLTVGAPLSGTGIATASYPSTTTTIVSFSGTGIGSTIVMSAAATASSTNTAYIALATNTNPSNGNLNIVTVSSATGTNSYTISNDSGSGAVVVTVLHPNSAPPSQYNEIQINGRNSYAISDYSSPSGDIIQLQLMATVTQPSSASTSSPPIYILSVGTVSLYDTVGATSRQLTPTQYASQLSTLALAFKNSSYYNYGRVILTVPPLVQSGSGFSLLSPYTLNDYRTQIISLAKTLSCGYIDLTRVNLQANTFTGTGSISATTLNITAASSGALVVGSVISGSGISVDTVITAFGTGSGGAGTYTVNISQSAGSTTITAGDYQSGGLHPNSSGAAKLAKYYISMLEFSRLPA